MKKIFCLVVCILLMSIDAFAIERGVNVFYLNTLASAQVPKDGSLVRDNVVNQNYLQLRMDWFSVFYWNNFDIKKNEVNEYDFGMTVSAPKIFQIQPYLNFAHWHFPGYRYDNQVTIGFKYAATVNYQIEYTRLITDGFHDNRSRLFTSLSYSHNFLDNFLGNISVKSAYLNNFYGVTGLAYLTGGMGLDYAINDWVGFGISINYQKGFEQNDFWYGGLGFNLKN